MVLIVVGEMLIWCADFVGSEASLFAIGRDRELTDMSSRFCSLVTRVTIMPENYSSLN